MWWNQSVPNHRAKPLWIIQVEIDATMIEQDDFQRISNQTKPNLLGWEKVDFLFWRSQVNFFLKCPQNLGGLWGLLSGLRFAKLDDDSTAHRSRVIGLPNHFPYERLPTLQPWDSFSGNCTCRFVADTHREAQVIKEPSKDLAPVPISTRSIAGYSWRYHPERN